MDLDLNGQVFQEGLLELEKPDVLAFFKTLYKLKKPRWERVMSVPDDIYTIRITRKCRAVVKREGDVLRFIFIHPDHDSAYRNRNR